LRLQNKWRFCLTYTKTGWDKCWFAMEMSFDGIKFAFWSETMIWWNRVVPVLTFCTIIAKCQNILENILFYFFQQPSLVWKVILDISLCNMRILFSCTQWCLLISLQNRIFWYSHTFEYLACHIICYGGYRYE
jgi:hypothetical protein